MGDPQNIIAEEGVPVAGANANERDFLRTELLHAGREITVWQVENDVLSSRLSNNKVMLKICSRTQAGISVNS